jgi:hypothetical protein
MLKFFRKYNKIILVIGGSLLMIAFLVPQALQQIGQAAAGRAVVRFEGGSFSMLDIQRAASEIAAVQMVLGVEQESLGIENEEHWLLLVAEARRAGFRGGPEDAAHLIDQIARGYAQQFVQQFGGQMSMDQAFAEARNALLQRRVQVSGGNTQAVDTALADLFAIQRLRSGYFAAPKMSTARTVKFAHRLLDIAQVGASIVPADSLIAEIPQPSTPELEAQFNAFRDVNRGEGEFGFGYRQPVGVKVEWITLNPAAIADAVTLDPIEVRKRFEAKRDLYPGDFASERDNVRRELTNEKVATILTDAEQEIRGRGLDDVRDFPESGGFRQVPENWQAQRTPLETIADAVVARIREKHGITVDVPFVGVQNDAWLSPTEFQQLPGLGRSFVRDGLRAIPLWSALEQIKETMPEGSTDTPRFQVGVLDRPAFDAADQQHYFRFLDARRAGPPASIDEVREQVARDVRRLRAYDLLVERAESASVRDALIARGPKAAANIIDPTIGEMTLSVSDERAAPLGNPLSGELVARVVNDDGFRDAVMGAARELDPLEPVALQPMEARSSVIPVRSALAVAFTRINARDPLTRDEYEQLQPQIVAAALQEEFATTGGGEAGNPFSFERTKERLGYTLVGRRAADRQDEPSPEDADPDASEPARAANP